MLLYSAFETVKHLVSHPIGKSSRVLEAIFTPPFPLGVLPGAKETKAIFNLISRLNMRYEKPDWRIEETKIGEDTYKITYELVDSKPFGNLLHFRKDNYKGGELPTILIVAPMSGHYPTLLRDTVRGLLPTHDVFITEWVNARDVPLFYGDFSLDDYVTYLIEFLEKLHKMGRKVHLMSVCQPTVPSLVAQSVMCQQKNPAQAKSMIMIGGPIDARKSPTAVTNFALEHDITWFEKNLISFVPYPYMGTGRLVYPGFLQYFGFVAMNPNKHADAHQQYFEDLTKGDESSAAKHREFYDEYNAVMDLPSGYYLQTIKKVFQDFDLPLGKFKFGELLVEPQKITNCALLTIEGELDDISGAGQTHAAHTLCSSIKKSDAVRKTVAGVGHYGVFSGSKFKSQIVPIISDFTKKYN